MSFPFEQPYEPNLYHIWKRMGEAKLNTSACAYYIYIYLLLHYGRYFEIECENSK